MSITDFKADGYFADSAFSGYELQINSTGEAARYRIVISGTHGPIIIYGRYQEVKYTRRGKSFILDWHGVFARIRKSPRKLYFDNFMRY